MRQILLMTGAVLLAAGCAKQTVPVESGGPEDLAIRVSAQVDGMTRSSYGAGIPESLKEFDLLVEKNFMGTNYLVLRGKTDYKAELSTSPVGNMVKLENLFSGIHENEEFLLKKIDQYQNDLDASKSEYEKPFAYETELKEKLARQYELNAQLDLENGKVEDVDLSATKEELDEGNIEKSENDKYVAEAKTDYQTNTDDRCR